MKKIIPIAGDIVYQGMGISIKDLEKIVENVNIVIHSAATVKFDEPLRYLLKEFINKFEFPCSMTIILWKNYFIFFNFMVRIFCE